MCLSVGVSVRQDISGITRAVLPNFLCMLPVSVIQPSSDTFTIGRITYCREGVFFPLTMYYRPGKGDWSARRGQSMLPMVALFMHCRERVHVKGFGVFLFVLYPGAFVDVATDQLLSLSAWQQLRIFCAGIWHNFVVVIFALTVLLCLPMILAPFYISGQSVLVTGLTEVLISSH